MTKSTKVLVIGLDGGTYHILEPFAREGLIPNLARLMSEGARGILRSTVPPISAPAWATFQTGKNPGKHGLFNFFDLSESGFRSSHNFRTSRVVNHASIGSATVYDYLRAGDRKVISINIPLTYPTPEVDGHLIACWLSPPGSKEFAFPRSLADELPDYRIDQDFGEGMYAMTPGGKELDSDFLLDDLSDIMRRRADAACYLMQNKAWDVCMVCFTETDRLHHFLWRAVNPSSRDTGDGRLAHERERFRAFYTALDTQIGRLMADAGPDTNVIIMSDHGFDDPPTRRYHVSHWMQERGWLITRAQGAPKKPPASGVSQLAAAAKRGLRKVTPVWFKRMVYEQTGYTPALQEVDWAATRAWSFGVNNNLGAICVNQREPGGPGGVAPGPELDRLVDEIIEGLQGLRDPASGRPVVQWVKRREEVYEGPYVTRFPHILFLLDPDFEADYESAFVISESRIKPDAYPNGRGNHRPEGICVASGPDILAGVKPDQDLASIMPTILHLTGAPIPDDLDGVVMMDYLRPESRKARSADEAAAVEHRFSAPSEDDVLALQEKLKHLGYM